MTSQTVTIALPEQIYQQATNRAQRAHQSIEDELVTTVVSVYGQDLISAETVDTLKELNFLDDQELWQAAHLQVSEEVRSQIETLLTKRQMRGLTPAEEAEIDHLVGRADHVMLVRSKAAALLKTRGHDVTPLITPHHS